MDLIFSDYGWVLLLILIWTLPWKGVALWKAARNEDQWWFIAVLLLNTLAILDILYIYFFSEKRLPAGRQGRRVRK